MRSPTPPSPDPAVALARVAPIAAAALLLALGCDAPPAPACGDGRLDEGEDVTTCCADAGCERGVCDEARMICVDPWLLSCTAPAGACATDGPWRCRGDAPPEADCEGCGCPDGATCQDGVCYAPETLALVRDRYGPPEDLPLDGLFALFDDAATAEAMTYAELEAEIDRRLREDPRRVALLLGESHGSDAEQALGVQLLRDLAGRGWAPFAMDVEGDPPILDPARVAELGVEAAPMPGDLTNAVHCAAAEAAIGERLNEGGLYVQYMGSGHTSYETCHHLGHWGICDPPHVAECVTALSRGSITVVLFDPDPWLWLTDQVLLRRLDALAADPAALGAELDRFLARWAETMDAQPLDPAQDAVLDGEAVNVRVIPGWHAPDVFFAYFPRPDRPAYLLRSFAAVWGDDALRAFMVDQGLGPGSCSISWDLSVPSFSLWCANDAAELTATVTGLDFALTESSTTPPGA